MSEEIQEEIQLLLSNFWILKKNNPKVYHSIKRHQEQIRNFIIKNLGSKLIIHDKFIKLEKLPSIPSSNLGIKEFSLVSDYVYLCLVLLFLEDKPQGIYFTLNNLIEYVKSTSVSMELSNVPDWKSKRDRKSCKRAIDYLINLGVIELRDKSNEDFSENENANALYLSTGLSNYVMKVFNNEIFDYKELSDFVKDEWTYQDEDKGDIRKYKIYRNLLYTPVVLSKYLTDSERDYLKKLRGHIREEFMDNLGLELEVTRNMSLVYDYDDNKSETFPNKQKISGVVLMINEILYNMIMENKIDLDNYEIGKIKKEEFYNIVIKIKYEKVKFLTVQLKNLTDEVFCKSIIDYMEELSFIKEENDEIIIYPSIRLFISNIKQSDKEQLEMF